MQCLPVILSAVVVISLFPAIAAAGANTATISCTAIGGAFKLRGKIPATEDGLDLTFSDRHGAMRYQGEAGFAAAVTEEFAEGRFDLEVEGDMGLKLVSVAKTLRASIGSDATTASFDAVLTGAPKTSNPATKHPKLRMRCTYDYSV